MRTERGAGGIAVRYIGFVGLVLLAAVPIYVYVEPPWRAAVTRLAAAIVVGVALLELRARLARRVSGSSALEDARRRHATESGVPARLLDLMDDVLTGTGKFVLKQTDFGIEPTTAAAGLVKVEDGVTVTFRIVARGKGT